MPDYILNPETGEIALGETEDGVAYRSVPSRFLPDEFAGEIVLEAIDAMPPSTGVTNAKARVRLREAGIHPYPKDVDQYRKQRMMTEGDKRRHSRKIANQQLKARGLDEKAKRAVEGS